MSFDCLKFTENALSAENAPEETTDEFTLMPSDKQANEEEFSLLKRCLQETRCEDPEPFVDLKHAKIYKIKCNTASDEPDFKFGNILMLHGTNFENSRKILKEGYESSHDGYFGSGVYMTESIDIAAFYSLRKTHKFEKLVYKNKNMKTYVFVNEVAEPESLKVEKYGSYRRLKMNSALPKHPFCKYMHKDSPERKMEIDDEGRFNSDEKLSGLSLKDEYVADGSLIKPRFLIKIESPGFNYEKYINFHNYLATRFYN